MISSCFDYRGPRNKVVMVEQEFPSVQYFYNEQRRLGARVETVPSGGSGAIRSGEISGGDR